jgi:hypothetical protein
MRGAWTLDVTLDVTLPCLPAPVELFDAPSLTLTLTLTLPHFLTSSRSVCSYLSFLTYFQLVCSFK